MSKLICERCKNPIHSSPTHGVMYYSLHYKTILSPEAAKSGIKAKHHTQYNFHNMDCFNRWYSDMYVLDISPKWGNKEVNNGRS